jgi:membrane protease YdiL (CAAX protease family)
VYHETLQKRGLRRLANLQGAGLLLGCALQMAIIMPLSLTASAVIPSIESSPLWWMWLQLALTVLTLFPAALLALALLNPVEHNNALPFTKPFAAQKPRGLLTCMVVCVGLLVCFLGGVFSSVLESLCNALGFSLQLPEAFTEQPSGGAGLVVFRVIVMALSPAFIEEILMRGAVLQPLRRFGDSFAVVTAALLFALLHGNILQGVFAFFAGLAMGYAAVFSGSLWPAIMIHFINNAVSVGADEIMQRFGDWGEGAVNIGYILFNAAVGLAGLLLFVLLRRRLPRLQKPKRLFSAGRALVNYLFCSVPMLLAVGYYLYEIAAAIGLSLGTPGGNTGTP